MARNLHRKNLFEFKIRKLCVFHFWGDIFDNAANIGNISVQCRVEYVRSCVEKQGHISLTEKT